MLTNEQRVKNVCKELERLWLKKPELKLGQLISHAMVSESRDITFLSDSEFLQHIDRVTQ